MKDNYLHSLVGRAVQVYRGGPDSNNGKLLDVSEDFLALQIEDGTIIYYKTSHLKSVREDPQNIFSSINKEDDNESLLKARQFNELASLFKDQTIRINGNGPESREGKLIDVKEDYLVLSTKEDGLLFYKVQHIKSLSTPIAKETESEELEDTVTTSNQKYDQIEESPTELETIVASYNQVAAETMIGLLTNLKNSWIKINRKGPESVEGLLIEINSDHIVLAVDKQIYRIVLYHVKNFSVSVNNADQQKNEQQESNQKSNSQNSNNQEQQTNQGQSNRQVAKQELRAQERAEYFESRKRMKKVQKKRK